MGRKALGRKTDGSVAEIGGEAISLPVLGSLPASPVVGDKCVVSGAEYTCLVAGVWATARGKLEAFTYAGATLTLSLTPVGDLLVLVQGQAQVPGDVTVSGKNITALPNAQSGDTVLVHYWGV